MKFSLYLILFAALSSSVFAQEAQNPPPTPDDTTAPAATPPQPQPPKKPIPQTMGDRTGQVWIGIRTVIDRRSGWGWIKKENEDWNQAQWAILEEKPGVIKAPGRYTGNVTSDHLMTYRLYGDFEEFKGYEPDFDVFVPVFRLKGFEVIGPGEALNKQPPFLSGSGPSRFAERGANIRH